MDEDDPLALVDVDLATQSLLLASANHDLDAIRDLLKTTPSTVQDSDTGFTPLHAAIAACDQEQTNGFHEHEADEIKEEFERATDTVRLLLQNGAVWNDVDANGETPGCIARRLGIDASYQLIVDAGVRVELIHSKLHEYQQLEDDDDPSSEPRSTADTQDNESQQLDFRRLSIQASPTTGSTSSVQHHVEFPEPSNVLSGSNVVIEQWQKPLMERHASLLLPQPGLRLLTVGHGTGIIGEIFQSHSPVSHHIIEAQPDVLAKMKEHGWLEKPGVIVHEGRWQDVLSEFVTPEEDDIEAPFNAIFFDTSGEDFGALREFFSEWTGQLLHPDGQFSFFNGIGTDRQVYYDVYNKVIEIELLEAGLDVEWEDVPVSERNIGPEPAEARRPHWVVETYKLPTCNLVA